MIFVDSNIPMYLIGKNHPNKNIALQIVERLIQNREVLITSAEVFQEILHRFSAQSSFEHIQPCFDLLSEIVEKTVPVLEEDVHQAKGILMGIKGLSSRDALHVASMKRCRIATIFSFDTGFDQVPGLLRLPNE